MEMTEVESETRVVSLGCVGFESLPPAKAIFLQLPLALMYWKFGNLFPLARSCTVFRSATEDVAVSKVRF